VRRHRDDQHDEHGQQQREQHPARRRCQSCKAQPTPSQLSTNHIVNPAHEHESGNVKHPCPKRISTHQKPTITIFIRQQLPMGIKKSQFSYYR
jgi:hypothetical protein